MKLFLITVEYFYPNSEKDHHCQNYVLAESAENVIDIFNEWLKKEDEDTIVTSLGINELPMIEQVLPNI